AGARGRRPGASVRPYLRSIRGLVCRRRLHRVGAAGRRRRFGCSFLRGELGIAVRAFLVLTIKELTIQLIHIGVVAVVFPVRCFVAADVSGIALTYRLGW